MRGTFDVDEVFLSLLHLAFPRGHLLLIVLSEGLALKGVFHEFSDEFSRDIVGLGVLQALLH